MKEDLKSLGLVLQLYAYPIHISVYTVPLNRISNNSFYKNFQPMLYSSVRFSVVTSLTWKIVLNILLEYV
jgi:hypothetical protein